MTRKLESSSPWINDFRTQLLRQKHVILYGNIYDQFLWQGGYQPIHEFLTSFFASHHFDIIVRYDPVDGLIFADKCIASSKQTSLKPGMEAKYNALVTQGIALRHPEITITQQTDHIPLPVESSQDRLTPPSRTVPMVGTRGGSTTGQRIAADKAFGDMRMALTQRAVSLGGIIDLGDLLTTDPARYSTDERESLALLKKCTMEASLILDGPLQGYRNTLVLLAGDLKRVPEWLYLDNPHVAIVQVERPHRGERRQFALNFIRPSATSGGFCGGNSISDSKPMHGTEKESTAPSELEALAEEFADLTDGMKTLDLNALRMTSHIESIKVRHKGLRQLIDFYKVGLKDDPWENLNSAKVRDASQILAKSVIGQPRAVEAVVGMLTSGKVGLTMSGRHGATGKPKGIFFFVGPTGVGKTELAKAMTELVFGDARAFARFDMSEYKEEHAAEKLAGAPPGFVGYEEGGQLTNRVLRQPHSILLFDEIEKAHPKVLDKFLQILEDGRLTDGKGQTAYFNQTAIIFTSNIGASDLTNPENGRVIREGIMRRVMTVGADKFTQEEVSAHFRSEVDYYFTTRIGRAEILNRLGDNIVTFDLLRPEYVAQIAKKFLVQLAQAANEKYMLTIVFNDSVTDRVKAEMNQEDNLLFGGRRIKSVLETLIERPLNRWIFENVPDFESLQSMSLDVGLTAEQELMIRKSG